MSMTISFDLSDRDLQHFRDLMRAEIESAGDLKLEEVAVNARKSLREMDQANSPDFAHERISNLEALIDAVEDEEWQIPEDEKQEILTSLAYFSEPHDLVPDHIPVLGYIDDAIMIELVLSELSLDLATYRQFCDYREKQECKLGEQANVNRESWLQAKRSELQSELRRKKYARIRGRLFG